MIVEFVDAFTSRVLMKMGLELPNSIQRNTIVVLHDHKEYDVLQIRTDLLNNRVAVKVIER